MADKRRVESSIAIELFFEGKDHQRLVDVLAQQLDASLPPRPELRADVVNDRNATLMHLPRHPPIEGRRIDDDGEYRTLCIGRATHIPGEAEDFGQMAAAL